MRLDCRNLLDVNARFNVDIYERTRLSESATKKIASVHFHSLIH